MQVKNYHALLLFTVTAVLIWSGINPFDRLVWWLEVAPILIAAPIVFLTYRRFPLSNLMYTFLAIHSIILAYGGHSTYALAPLGEWMQETFGFARNHYDKIGHIAQGLFPFIFAREILLRTSPLTRGGWLTFVSICIPLAFAALYEIIEWWASLATGSAGDAFLGTQGYIWDTQSDMFLCLIGSIISALLFTRLHDRSLKVVSEK